MAAWTMAAVLPRRRKAVGSPSLLRSSVVPRQRPLLWVFFLVVAAVLLYLYTAAMVWTSYTVTLEQSFLSEEEIKNQTSSYERFYTIVTELAWRSPQEILQTLRDDDPLGVRRVAQQLADLSQERNHTPASLAELQRLFPCPAPKWRLSLPDRRNATQLQLYHQSLRDPSITAFLFFQHLRKAGGTHFCTLAQKNLPAAQVPSYYCMPDYHWPQRNKGPACAGCLHHWTNAEILAHVGAHRILGNEWDSFDVAHHFQLPAIFVTSFRAPLHRAVSQYRFECVEERGCTHKTIESCWKNRRDLYNIYTYTFSDIPLQGSFATDAVSSAAANRRATSIATAFDTLLQFHLVLVMEWLAYAAGPVRQVLDFPDTSVLTQAVRPHNDRKQRTDSWVPEEFLSPEQYRIMSETLALDEILYDVARRLFLERLVCNKF